MNRVLHYTNPLMHGPDVRLVQNLLVGVGILHKGDVDGVFGTKTARGCVTVKERLGYPAKACVPTAGADLVAYLQGKKRLPAAYVVRRRARSSKHPTQPTSRQEAVEKKRDAIVAWWRWAIAHASQSRYGQLRPIQFLTNPNLLPCTTDCSGDGTKGAKAGGAPDPNGRIGGRLWSGLGFTGTMIDSCRHITRAEAKRGDYAIFGIYPGDHVVTLLEDVAGKSDDEIECGSNGHQGDPGGYKLAWFEQELGPVTYWLSAF